MSWVLGRNLFVGSEASVGVVLVTTVCVHVTLDFHNTTLSDVTPKVYHFHFWTRIFVQSYGSDGVSISRFFVKKRKTFVNQFFYGVSLSW